MSKISFSIIKDKDEIDVLRHKSSFNYTYDKATIELLKKNFKLKDSLYIIAEKESKFAAFCSTDRDWWEDNYFFIREILVDPKFQKQGIGEEMIKKCISHAKKCGAIGVVTETDFENMPMKNLCKKLGFNEWDNPQWKDGITYKLIF